MENLIEALKKYTSEAILILPEKEVEKIFSSLPKVQGATSYGMFENTSLSKARSIGRSGVTLHFINQENVSNILFRENKE